MIRLLRNLRVWIWLAVPLIVSGVLMTYPGGPLMAFQDVAEASKNQEIIKSVESDKARMQEELVTIHDRLQRKEELLEAWIDHRLTFPAVCENFRDINSTCPKTLRIQRDLFGEDISDRELAAMNVVLYLDQRIDNSATPYYLKNRLDQDYKTLFGHRPLR